MKRVFTVGEQVTCVNNQPLEGKRIAPPLIVRHRYKVEEIFIDKEGNQHLHVGLKSHYSYITSYETGEELPDGDKKHWCHPSRFE